MKCPICPDVTLVIADRQGIEIDYCPQCRGVWLDRGELDRLIERAAASLTPAASAPGGSIAPTPGAPASTTADGAPAGTRPLPWYDEPETDRYAGVEYDKHGRPKKSKKKKASSFLEDLFDF